MKQPLVSAAALAVLSAAGAHAQELLTTQDGVSLRGTVRLLQGNAATCNVIAENEQGNFEARRVNQDQPLHLWELEFSVFNGSGRALDHLVAYYDIASPWPPCTNWTAQFDGLGMYQWADPSGRIQHTSESMPTLPNQTHTETVRVLAFNGVRPQFSEWSVNYTFLEGETATAPVQPNQAANLSVPELPPIDDEQDVFFGDDSGSYSNDGECDDPRFEGPGAFVEPLDEDMFRDATDCRVLFERGEVWLAEAAPAAGPPRIAEGQDFSFGDDTSVWANDGECDDPRFEGPGTADRLLEEDLLRDATDCRELLERGQIWLSEADAAVGAPAIEAEQDISLADETAAVSEGEGQCDLPWMLDDSPPPTEITAVRLSWCNVPDDFFNERMHLRANAAATQQCQLVYWKQDGRPAADIDGLSRVIRQACAYANELSDGACRCPDWYGQ